MHVAEVDFWCCICPATKIFKFKAHLAHVIGNFFIVYRLAINKGLLRYNFEFATLIATESENRKPCLWKICIME